MQDRPTTPPGERAYEPLYDRIDRLEERLEDAISHFYNAINELRERVSTLEKKHH